MTGFGAATVRFTGRSRGTVSVEIKGVNQRFLDLKLSLPREYAPWEADLRKIVQDRVARGRVEVYVNRSVPQGERGRVEIDEALAAAYVELWRKLKKKLGVAGDVDLAMVAGLSDLYRPRETTPRPEAERPALWKALARSLSELDRARTREGKHLERDICQRLAVLERLASTMAERAAASREETRRRIEERMRELLEGRVDETRILQEAAMQAERSDVSEEVVRLRSHLAGLRDLARSTEAVGKRIEFLLQEVQREVNTVASKSSDLGLTQAAVEAKSEVEKIREQVQNVE
ncbi:MAG: YicC/YloC family endoribonuclease [Candidatus Binatia bacterium]